MRSEEEEKVIRSFMALLDHMPLTGMLDLVNEAAKRKERDIEQKNNSELMTALHYAICQVHDLAKKKRGKNYMKVLKQFAPSFWETYIKYTGEHSFSPATRDFAKMLEEDD